MKQIRISDITMKQAAEDFSLSFKEKIELAHGMGLKVCLRAGDNVEDVKYMQELGKNIQPKTKKRHRLKTCVSLLFDKTNYSDIFLCNKPSFSKSASCGDSLK